MKKNILGSAIKYLRKVNHLTQNELSELTGFKQSTISGHENKHRSIDERDIKIYSDAFKISPQVLFDIASKLESGENITESDIKKLIDSQLTSEHYLSTLMTKNNDNLKVIASHIDDDVTEEDMEDILKYIELIKKSKK